MRTILTEKDILKELEKEGTEEGGDEEDDESFEETTIVHNVILAPEAPAIEITAKKRPDDYTDRLLKFIPVEVVSVYIFVYGLITSSQVSQYLKIQLLWIVFIVMVIGTGIYLLKVQNVYKKTQIAVSTMSFIIWVFATGGGPFAYMSWYQPIYGQVLLPIYTFFVAMIKPEK